MLRKWRAGRAVLVAGLVLAGLAVGPARAAQPIYTKDNAPAAPELDKLPLTAEVSQYGIKWKFGEPARVGQFVNGDYYVVGPVTVSEVTPKPLLGREVPEDQLDQREKDRIEPAQRLRNGSVLNPPAKQQAGYDSGIKSWYRHELNAPLPIAMKPGDSLVSTISLKQDERASFIYHSVGKRTSGDNCPIKVAAILTCVDKPQPADAFRPGYCDREQTVYLSRNLRRDLLLSLPRVESEWDPVKFAAVFQRPWLNTGFFGFDQPMENMPHYGRWPGQAVGNAGLLLSMDFTPEQKEPLLVNFVQVSIDYWSVVKNGHPGWEGWGGHGSGRKLPIVLGGVLLGDDVMASPNKAFPKCNFGEDNQTAYGECWTGAKVVFTGHSGIHADGSVPRKQWGPYEHLHPTEWKNDGGLKNWQSEGYRRCCSSNCWVGQALTLRLMKIEKQWDHDAFLDYVDRWMYEDDTEFRRQMAAAVPEQWKKDYGGMADDENTWAHQGFTSEDWIAAAWKAYRTLPGMAPTDGWKKGKPE